MAYDRVNYRDVDAVAEGMHFLRDPLDADNLGLTVVDVDAGWTGKEHDHGDSDHEEIYLLVDGSATVTVDGDDLDLSPGDAVRIDPDSSRRVHADEASTFVIAGAP